MESDIVKELETSEIKECCELEIEDFDSYKNGKVFCSFLKHENHKIFYKHFLTRVIEAINKKEKDTEIFIQLIPFCNGWCGYLTTEPEELDIVYKTIDNAKTSAIRKYLEIKKGA